MEQIEILMKTDSDQFEYLKSEILQLENFDLEQKNYVNYKKLIVKTTQQNKEKLYDLITNTIIIFYKFGVLNTVIRDIKHDIIKRYALLGALISVEIENEKTDIKKSIITIKKIAIDSYRYFHMEHLCKRWLELANLSNQLVDGCTTRNEFYDLLSYFLSSNQYSSKVTITDNKLPKVLINDHLVTPPPLTSEYEHNLLMALLSFHPSHIIIKNQEVLGEDFLKVVRALGQRPF